MRVDAATGRSCADTHKSDGRCSGLAAAQPRSIVLIPLEMMGRCSVIVASSKQRR